MSVYGLRKVLEGSIHSSSVDTNGAVETEVKPRQTNKTGCALFCPCDGLHTAVWRRQAAVGRREGVRERWRVGGVKRRRLDAPQTRSKVFPLDSLRSSADSLYHTCACVCTALLQCCVRAPPSGANRGAHAEVEVG